MSNTKAAATYPEMLEDRSKVAARVQERAELVLEQARIVVDAQGPLCPDRDTLLSDLVWLGLRVAERPTRGRADDNFKRYVWKAMWIEAQYHRQRRNADIRRHREYQSDCKEVPAAAPTEEPESCGDVVAMLLSSLTERQRETIALVAFGGLSPYSVAKLQGITAGTVKSQLECIRKKVSERCLRFLTEQEVELKLQPFASKFETN